MVPQWCHGIEHVRRRAPRSTSGGCGGRRRRRAVARRAAHRAVADSAVRLMLLDVLGAAAARSTENWRPARSSCGCAAASLSSWSRPLSTLRPPAIAATRRTPLERRRPRPGVRDRDPRRGRCLTHQPATPRSAQEPGGAGSGARRSVDQRVALRPPRRRWTASGRALRREQPGARGGHRYSGWGR